MSRGKIKAACKNILIKAGMADEKLAHMLTQIDRFLDGKTNTGIQSLPKDIKEFVTRVKKEYEIEIRHRAHLEYLTLSREEQITARLDLFGNDLIEGFLSMFRGSNRIVKGARVSVDSLNLGTLRDLIVGQSKDFEDAGVLKIWSSGKRDADVIDAYYQLIREGKKSEDPVIKSIVEILHKWEKETISRLNSVGARIELEPGYLFRGSVDRVKLTDAKFQKWSDLSMKYFDVKAMQKAKPADMEWIDYLESIYAEQATGRFKIANGAADSTVPSGFLAGNAQLARKTSAQAKMIFKDGQAHFAYIQDWGEKGFHAAQSVIFSMEHSSRNYALMEVLGPSPKRLVKKIIAERQAKLQSGENKDPGDIDKLIAQLKDTVDGMPRQLSDAFKEIDGTTRIPGNVTAASIGTGLRIAKNMALLGKIVLRSVTDFATIQSEARFQGIPFATALESHFISATALFKGSDAKEFGRLVHIGQEAVTSSLLDKFGIDQLGSGLGSQLQRYYFKLNGITYWNDALKSGFALMGATHLGNHAKFDWDELATHNYRVQRLLNIYDLDRHDWDVIRKTVYKFGKGNHSVLTPDRIEELPDEIIELLLTRKGLNPDDEALKRSFAEQLDETHALVKEQRMIMQEGENIIQTNIAQRLKQLNRQPQLEAKFKKIKTETQLKDAITELDKEITQLEEFLEKPYQGPREKEKSKRDILQDRELLKSLKEERTALSQVKVAEGKVKRDDIPTVGEVNKLNKQAGKIEEEIAIIQGQKQKLQEGLNKLKVKNIEGELKRLSEEKIKLEQDIRKAKAIQERITEKGAPVGGGPITTLSKGKLQKKVNAAERRLKTNETLTKRLDRAKKLKDDIEDLDKQVKIKNKGLQEIKEFAASKKAEQRATVETQMREEFAFANVKKEVVSDEGFIGQTKLTFSTKRINRARADLSEKLNVLYQDRNNYAVLIPGARERAFFNRGTQPGTVLGEAVRFFAQFKTFPLAVYTKTLERDILAGGAQSIKQGLVEGMPFTAGNNGGDLVGIAGFMSAMTFYGSLGTMANDFFNGRTQRDWSDPKSIVDGAIAGGGFGLYSAAILESYSSTAHFQSASNAFGPVVGDIPDLLSLTIGAFNGEPKAQKFLDFLHGYTPLANVFYAKAVLDYLIFYNLQEAIDPGALLRMQQAVKKSSGQDFNIKPSDIIPHGGGIPSF
jgi:hypothetical protein